MISEVIFRDIHNSPINYLSSVDYFNKCGSIHFKSGVNIIVGNNGSGKTTLLKLLRYYCLCSDSIMSGNVSNKLFDMYKIKGDKGILLHDGISVISDYNGAVFNLLDSSILHGNKSNVLSSAVNFGLFYNILNESSGEGLMTSIGTLFNIMFNEKNINLDFPINWEADDSENSDSNTMKRLLIDYYRKNSFKYNGISAEKEYTVLMDEPDKNLDIHNLESIYNILREKKDGIQLIVVINNPLLIYRLSKCSDINFIELTDNYVNEVKKFVECE